MDSEDEEEEEEEDDEEEMPALVAAKARMTPPRANRHASCCSACLPAWRHFCSFATPASAGHHREPHNPCYLASQSTKPAALIPWSSACLVPDTETNSQLGDQAPKAAAAAKPTTNGLAMNEFPP